MEQRYTPTKNVFPVIVCGASCGGDDGSTTISARLTFSCSVCWPSTVSVSTVEDRESLCHMIKSPSFLIHVLNISQDG